MATSEIPLRNDLPHFSLRVQLDASVYGMEFVWNFRANAWFFSLFDAAGEPIFEGQRLVVDFPLGSRLKDARLPKGILVVTDTTGKQQDPGFEDLGSRVQLSYTPLT